MMELNHINEQCAAMMGWEDVRSKGLPHCGLWHDNGRNTLYRVEGSQAFTPATNREHLQMCIEFAAKDEALWALFKSRVNIQVWVDKGVDGTKADALLLPTLTIATLLVEAWEEAR